MGFKTLDFLIVSFKSHMEVIGRGLVFTERGRLYFTLNLSVLRTLTRLRRRAVKLAVHSRQSWVKAPPPHLGPEDQLNNANLVTQMVPWKSEEANLCYQFICLQSWFSNRSRRRKTLNSNLIKRQNNCTRVTDSISYDANRYAECAKTAVISLVWNTWINKSKSLIYDLVSYLDFCHHCKSKGNGLVPVERFSNQQIY